LSTEPPKKRRKTDESTSPKRCITITIAGPENQGLQAADSVERPDEHVAAQPEPHAERTNDDNNIKITTIALTAEPVPKASKKTSRVRRKLCLDDEVKHHDGEARTGGLEDTFIFGLKPKKRQPTRKLEGETVPVTLKGTTTKKAPAKGRKATKAKQQTEDEDMFGLTVESPLEIVVPDELVDEGHVSKLSKQMVKKAPAKGKKGTKANQQTEDEHMSDLAAELSAEAAVPEETTDQETASEAPKQAPKKAPTKGKKATKAKQQTEDEHVSDLAAEVAVFEENTKTTADEQVTKPTSKKAPGKANKPTKATQQAEDEPVPEIATELPTESAVPEKKTKANRKKPVTRDLVAIVSMEPNTSDEAATINKAEPGPGDSGNPPPMAKSLNDETADPKSKQPKAKSAVKNVNKRSIDEVMSADMPDETTKRPRRQAAISAIQKVTLSYEEDLVSVDKLRRAPDVGNQLRRSKKANTCGPSASPHTMRSISVSRETLSGEGASLSCSPLLPVEASQTAPVKPVEACDDEPEKLQEVADSQTAAHVSPSGNEDRVLEEELSSNPPKIPAKRGRKPKAKTAEATPEELIRSDKLPAKRGRKPRVKAVEPDPEALPLSGEKVPAKRGRKAAGTASEAPPHVERLAAKRGLKPAVKATEATTETIHVEPPKAVLAIKETILAAVGPQESVQDSMDISAKATEKSVVVAEKGPRNKPVQEQPKKARRALADFDSNIVRHLSTAESKKLYQIVDFPASPPAKQQSRARTKPPVVPDDIGRHSKTQSAQQRKVSPDNNKPSRGTPASSRKRHVISAEEDLDWLFDKPETKRLQPATARHPASKTRRKDADQNAKDMDLDDLLASIAGFSGKLLTGKRGRAAAS
jgi:hypothetical protein